MKEVKTKQPRGRQNAWEGTRTRLNEDIHNFIFFLIVSLQQSDFR